MSLTTKSRKVISKVATLACGVLGLILLMWTPTTAKGILTYVVLFGVLILTAIVFAPRKDAAYWPNKPEDRV